MKAWGEEQLTEYRRKRLRSGASDLLGHQFLSYDPETKTARCGFRSQPCLLNPMGRVQGGVQAAMMDEVMIDALLIATGYGQYVPTLELKISFIRPARPGAFEAEARIVRHGRTAAFVEGTLHDQDGELVATASATCKLQPMTRRPSQRAAAGR